MISKPAVQRITANPRIREIKEISPWTATHAPRGAMLRERPKKMWEKEVKRLVKE